MDVSLFREIRKLGDTDGVIHLTVDYPEPPSVPHCFPAATPIAVSLTETRPISDIRVGDTVLAFDSSADLGRGALVPRKVVRFYGTWHCICSDVALRTAQSVYVDRLSVYDESETFFREADNSTQGQYAIIVLCLGKHAQKYSGVEKT